jgi:hypothetical protein
MTRTPPHVRPRQGVTRRLAAVTVMVAGSGLLTGCGSSLLGTTTSTGVASGAATGGSTTSTTVPVDGEVAVAFPVVTCADPAFGGSAIRSKSGWSPTILLAPVPTSLVGKVTFYTDGVHTLLAPAGWTCALVAPGPSTGGAPSATPTAAAGGYTSTTIANPPSTGQLTGQSAAIGAAGSTTLAVYPSNDPDPPITGSPAPGTEGVFATWASTGTNAGVDLVCPFFTIPSWQSQSAGCSTSKLPGELTNSLTPDVTAVADAAGAVANLAASGGQMVVSGVVLFPQIPSAISYGSPIAVAAESCALSDPSLCPTVLSDFEVREFPVPALSSQS